MLAHLLLIDWLACVMEVCRRMTVGFVWSNAPKMPLSLKRGKLRLSPSACTQCGACIGVCPTNALFLYGFSLEKATALVKSGETVFSCKDAALPWCFWCGRVDKPFGGHTTKHYM